MSDILEIVSGELYIYGNHIPRHTEKVWLFSASAVHKALEEVIRKKARSKNKDGDTYFENNRPAVWFRDKLKREESYLEKIATRTRNRIRKFGPAVGFGFHCERTLTMTNLDPDDFEDKELVYSGIRGNGKKAGTYLCQHAVVDYTASIDPDFRHELVDLFTQVVSGNVEEVTERVIANEKKAKGTPTRKENKQLNDELVEACGRKGVLPMKAQEGINIGVLGMTATKYKDKHSISEPFNDNLPEKILHVKNVGIILTTSALQEDARDSISNKEARTIGTKKGIRARLLFEDKDVRNALDRAVEEKYLVLKNIRKK